ncbi:hypothetical protein Hdeb2414_s0034g00726301 [Helianthus debilis subsp. tardiflorus]
MLQYQTLKEAWYMKIHTMCLNFEAFNSGEIKVLFLSRLRKLTYIFQFLSTLPFIILFFQFCKFHYMYRLWSM